jgi:hypothetical protein
MYDNGQVKNLAGYAMITLGCTGVRLPYLLRAPIAALSADTGISEAALQREVLSRVRASFASGRGIEQPPAVITRN